MGLTYFFKFSAPSETDPETLSRFLQSVEDDARKMGFTPTIVVNALFDSDERRMFARRLTSGYRVEDSRLKGVQLQSSPFLAGHDAVRGECRIMPEHGVLLVITDENRRETAFGFFRYPQKIKDNSGREVIAAINAGDWLFSDFIKTADVRYRKIVRRFAEAGYLLAEQDDYHVALPP